MRCSYCYYKESHVERVKVMERHVLEAAIHLGMERSLQFKQKFLNITFFGGEPLLCMDSIRHGVAYAKSVVPQGFGLQFAVNTNGTLLNSEIIQFLKDENFQIFLSLDGSAQRHNICRRLVNGQGSVGLIEPYLDALKKMRTVVLSVVTRENMRGLAESIEWIYRQGFLPGTTAVDFDGRWTGEEFDVLALEYGKIADFWLKLKLEKRPFYLGTIQDKVKIAVENSRYRNFSCHVYYGGISVAADGSVFPCTRFIASNAKAPYCMGNVFTGIDEGVALQVRDFLVKEKLECQGCAIRHRCAAHECACTSFYTTGTLGGVSAEVCSHERMLAEICDKISDKLILDLPV